MDIIFNLLKKTLVLGVFVAFAFVFVYVPQPYSQINKAQAFPVTEVGPSGAANIATAASNALIAGATVTNTTKEFALDAIGWVLAKAIVSTMVASTIDWINSGFKGSPAFVQDLGDFLLNVADQVAGEYIQNLGGNLSFLCDPFKLDIQIALALEYQVAREDKPYEGCTLTGVINNIDAFISGNFSSGGWDDWFDVTMNPEIYTPYGQLQKARAGFNAAITDAQGNEIEFLRYGKGFLSSKICSSVDTPNGSKQKCKVTLPGDAIASKLNKSLGAGQDALITADELNEVIAALLGQVAQKALTGAAGILGLSANTGHTYQGFSGGSITSQLQQDAGNQIGGSVTGSASLLTQSLQVQTNYKTLATTYASRFSPYLSRYRGISAIDKQTAQAAYTQTQTIITNTTKNIQEIQTAITQYNQLETEYNNPTTTDARKQQIRTEQATLINTFTSQRYYTQTDYDTSKTSWDNILNTLGLS